jgi:N-acetyl-anhydromuramyl-L-alanine amidase AmpD
MNFSEDTSELLKTEFQSLPLVEVLQKPPSALLSVSDGAATALGNVGVRTIFDLALSRVFDAASQLTDAGENASNALNRFGAPASDMLSAPLSPDARVSDVRFMSPSILAGIPDANAFITALGVKTVRDVAFYPPYLAARQILNNAFFPERDGAFDPEAPADLIPKSGQFPTERAQYRVLLLDEIHRPDHASPLIDFTSPDFRPVDVSPVTAPDFGFRTIGSGALLTFNQSWFMQGVTLGHLLHSVALAPGESTRIAIVDWSRKSRAGQTEQVAETEDLLNDTAHNRSISEVTQAVAKEAQSGFSHTETDFTTEQGGLSFGEGIAGVFGPVAGALGLGASGSAAETSGSADSYASSSGQRSVAASMLQQITDRTHQQAHAARTRRASVVREVSQSEHEEISTRVVVNYNHMHALTVQYYEVLQLFRTETSVVRADRVIFIPFRLVDFNNDDLLLRFRGALMGAALNPQVRDALMNLNMLEIAPDPNVHFHGLNGAIKDALANPGRLPSIAFGPPVNPPGGGARVAARAADTATTEGSTTAAAAAETPPPPPSGVGVSANAVRRRMATALWSDQLIRLMNTLGGGVVRSNSSSLFVPSDVKLINAEVNSAAGDSLSPVFYKRDGSAITDLSGNQVALSDIARIAVRGSSANTDITAAVALTLIRNSVVFPLELPAVTIVKGATETRVVQINVAGADVNLKQELMDHQLYYSQAVFRTLDSAAIAGLLSNLSMKLNGEVVSVAQAVDPIPLRVVGNYLAFKMSADPAVDDDWKSFLDRRGITIGQSRVEFVPLSSGGVFAEAVLGRSNSAEKLDITRFWNWQDSPIPIQPSDIAPIVAQSRAQSDAAIAPGQLSAPIVSIQQPTELPDPSAAFAATIAAIQNGSMFRDMSGLSDIVKLAQSAIQASSAGATAAGQQASSNEQNAVNAAADIFKAYLAQGGNKNTAADKSASQQGALVNEYDKRKGGTASGRTASAAGPTNGSTSGSGGDGGATSPSPSSSSGNPGLDVATFGPEGKPFDEAIRNALGLDPQSLALAGGAGSTGSRTTPPASLLTTFKIINKIHESDNMLQGVTVLVGGISISNNTGNQVTIDLASLPDGDADVVVTPRDTFTGGSDTSIGDPATNPPARLWLPYTASITKQGTTFTSADPRVTIKNKEITIRLMPKWMRIASGVSRGGHTPTVIVVHHTDDENRSPQYDPNFHSLINRSINAWIGNNFAPHYVIDRDGSVVKLGHESLQAYHADSARWDGHSPLNPFSIGIEVVHTNNPRPNNGPATYTEGFEQAQYSALIALLSDLTNTLNIDGSSIVGHSDVGTNGGNLPNTVVGRKSSDPGIQFDWNILEGAGLGLQRDPAPVDFTVAYGGFFNVHPTGRIQAGAPGVTPAIITELKNDLTLIGYSVSTGASYDNSVSRCVMVFCEHFLQLDGQDSVSRAMADVLKRVVAFLTP